MKENFANMTDEQLYSLLHTDKRTSKQAFEELYQRYATKIFTYCKKVLHNSPQAEDIFQEAFSKFYESAKDKKDMTNVAGYLLKIARNLCLNEKDRKFSDCINIESVTIKDYDRTYEKKEQDAILHEALQQLPYNYREALILKEFMDLSYGQIADMLDITLNMVRIRIFRAKEQLREILAPYISEFKNEN